MINGSDIGITFRGTICKLYLKKISTFIKEHRNDNEVEYLIPVSCIYIVTSLDLPTTFWCSESRQSP